MGPEVAAGTALAASAAPAAAGAAAASTIPAWLSTAGTGALVGGLGSYLMGGDPLQGMLLGGIGGGIGSATGLTDSLGSLFNPSAAIDLPWTAMNEANPAFVGPMAFGQTGTADVAPRAASGGIGGKIMDFLPYAGIAGAAGLLDRGMKPDSVGPGLKPERESRDVMPMERDQLSVDPQSYLTSGGNRAFFNPLQQPVRYYKKGGKAEYPDKSSRQINEEDARKRRARLDGDDVVDFVYERYMADDKYPGGISHYMMDEYGDVPITRKIRKGYMNGGSSQASSQNIPVLGRKIKGRGDGRSDDIPAMLSDGEFVISAPVVSALGNGSNDAGAKKLDRLQKDVLSRHYKGGKPRKSAGLGSYVH